MIVWVASNQADPNPIGQKYVDVIRPFLESHLGSEIDTEMINYLADLVSTTECELVGLREAADIIGVSHQRVQATP